MRHPDFQPQQPLSARGMRSYELKNFNTPRGPRTNEAARAAGSMLATDTTPRAMLASDAIPSTQDGMSVGSDGVLAGAPLARGVPGHVPLDFENDNVYTRTRSEHGWDRHADPQGEQHPEPASRPAYYAGNSESFAQADPTAESGASATLDAERSRRSVSFADEAGIRQNAS